MSNDLLNKARRAKGESMTHSPNEILARMMGLERNCCPRCCNVMYEHENPTLMQCDVCGHICLNGRCEWPDFANDANWAERLAAWLAEREDIAYFYYCWRLKRAVLIINRGTKIFDGTFCAAICAAGLWYNEKKGGAHA